MAPPKNKQSTSSVQTKKNNARGQAQAKANPPKGNNTRPPARVKPVSVSQLARSSGAVRAKDTKEAVWKTKLERWNPNETLTPLAEEHAVSTYQQFTKVFTNNYTSAVDLTVVALPGLNSPIYWDVTPSQSERCIAGVNQPLVTVEGDTDNDAVYERNWEFHYENVTNRDGNTGGVVSGADTTDVTQAHRLRTKLSLQADTKMTDAQGRMNSFVIPFKLKPLVSPNGVQSANTASWSRDAPLGAGPFTPNDPPIGVTNYSLQLPTSKSKQLQYATAHGKTADVSDGTCIMAQFSPDQISEELLCVSTNTGNGARVAVQTVAGTNNLPNQAIAASVAVPPTVAVTSYIPRIAPAKGDTLCFINDQDSSTTGMIFAGPQRPSFDQQNTFGTPYYLDLNTITTDKIAIVQWLGMPPDCKALINFEAAIEVAPKLTSKLVTFSRKREPNTPDPDDVFAVVKDFTAVKKK